MRSVAAWALAVLLLAGCGRTVVVDDDGGARASEAGLDRTADPVEHCINQRFWSCRREQAGGRIDDAAYMECLEPITATCTGAAWPPGCAPTVDESSACIELLASEALVGTPTYELLMARPECDLCP